MSQDWKKKLLNASETAPTILTQSCTTEIIFPIQWSCFSVSGPSNSTGSSFRRS